MKLKLAGLFLLVASLVSVARADTNPIHFTVTATANSSSYGYTNGQTYSFVFTTGSSFTENGDSAFSADSFNAWNELQSGESQIWATLTGSGLTGSFSDPTTAPSSYLTNEKGEGFLTLHVGSSNGQAIGVSTLSSVALGSIDAVLFFPEVVSTFSYPGVYTDPTAYFANYVGNYTATSGSLIYFYSPADSSNPLLTFTPTQLNISVIPEPVTYAAVFGVIALGFCAWRRRRF